MKKNVIKLLVFLFVFCIYMQAASFAQEQDIYFIAYVNRLENKVKSNWILPHGKLGEKTVIDFDIDKTGKLLNINILNSSGDSEFDQNALNAIYKSVPFESIPSNTKDDTVTIRFSFSQNDLEAYSISETPSLNDANIITYINNPIPAQASISIPLSNTSKPTKKHKKESKKKTIETPKQTGTHGINSGVTPKSIGAGIISLIIWPGLGQLINGESTEKAGTHAILGIIDIFRIWSCYDAVVDRKGGVWNNRI